MQAAICITDAGEQQVDVRVDSPKSLTWNRRKYNLCLACFPGGDADQPGLAVYMQQKFFDPLKCSEKDLFPWLLPPPLDRAVLYGAAVFIVSLRGPEQPAALGAGAWRRTRQSLDRTWVTLETTTPGPCVGPCSSPSAFPMKSPDTFAQEMAVFSDQSDEEDSLEEESYESDTSSEEGDTDVQSNEDEDENSADVDITPDDPNEYMIDDDFSSAHPTAKRRRYPTRRGGVAGDM